jgi:hypothetical protein
LGPLALGGCPQGIQVLEHGRVVGEASFRCLLVQLGLKRQSSLRLCLLQSFGEDANRENDVLALLCGLFRRCRRSGCYWGGWWIRCWCLCCYWLWHDSLLVGLLVFIAVTCCIVAVITS